MSNQYFGFLDTFLGEDDPQILAGDTGSFMPLSHVAPGGELVLFASGSDVSVRYFSLSDSSEAEVKQAAPFAVEDEIAETVEQMNVVLGKKNQMQDGRRIAHIVSSDLLESWKNALDGKYTGAISLVAEHSVLPDGAAVDIGPRILLNLDGKPVSYDKALPRGVLKSLVGDHRPALSKPKSPLLLMARMYSDTSEHIDLLGGRFRPRRSFSDFGHHAWLSTAKLAAAFAVACLVYLGADTWAAKSSARALQSQMQSLVQPLFPDQATIRNPLRAVSRAAADATEQASLGFLDSNAALYLALQELPGAQLRGVRYQPDRNGFVAQIAYADFGDDTKLKTLLAELGIEASFGDARQINGFVLGDVTLEGRFL